MIDMAKIRFFILLVLFAFNSNLTAQNFSGIHRLIEQNNYSQALPVINQKLITNSKNRELLFLKAQSEFKLNKIASAIKTYQLIIKLYPLFPEAYNNLAGIFAGQGKLELAKQILEKGMNTDKNYALLHNNIKNIYLEMARESYVKALRLGVKKHNVELNFARYEKQKKLPVKQSSASVTLVTSNKNFAPKNTTTLLVKKQKLAKLAIDKPLVTRQKLVGPKKTIRRIIKKNVVIKSWNESVISVKDEVITALQGWAAAWSAQDVDLYLSFYNKQFLPENGASRRVWVNQRQSRLVKPRWIEVRLSDFLFEQQTEDQAAVSVIQIYRSNSFRDKSKKKFLLIRSDDGWQILNEINSGE